MYQPILLPYFYKQIKKYIKKYKNFEVSIINELKKFDRYQHSGLGRNVYKIRFKSSGLAKGKSKSFRLIVLIIEVKSFIVPITLYFKGDKESITKREIDDHLEEIFFELKLKKYLWLQHLPQHPKYRPH